MGLAHQVTKLAGQLLRPVRAGDEKLARVREGTAAAGLRLTTTSFSEGGPIPSRYAGPQGASPALSWSEVPSTAKELVLLCEDPDAPLPKPYVHWALYGIAPSTHTLPESIPKEATLADGGVQGRNSAGDLGFTGPRPPSGHGTHHYHFQLFALDAPLTLPPGADRDALVQAMKGHVVACGEVVGTYETA
jgi:Raf kinase inhibitor-like YbhB/YbcL family protein